MAGRSRGMALHRFMPGTSAFFEHDSRSVATLLLALSLAMDLVARLPRRLPGPVQDWNCLMHVSGRRAAREGSSESGACRPIQVASLRLETCTQVRSRNTGG